MKERMTYTQLRPEERVVISSLKLLGELLPVSRTPC